MFAVNLNPEDRKNYKPTHCTSTMQNIKVVTFLELQQKPQRQINQKKSQELESIFNTHKKKKKNVQPK